MSTLTKSEVAVLVEEQALIPFVFDQNNARGYYLEGWGKSETFYALDAEQAWQMARDAGIDPNEEACPSCCGARWYLRPTW
jgi:hypothetical protein